MKVSIWEMVRPRGLTNVHPWPLPFGRYAVEFDPVKFSNPQRFSPARAESRFLISVWNRLGFGEGINLGNGPP